MIEHSKELACFKNIVDPRRSNRRHLLSDILFIACCAVICGAESWDDIEEYGHAKIDWLKQLLVLPHGIPSDDTFRRIFTLLEPSAFEHAFRAWIQTLISDVVGDVIPIDGKRLRGAFRASKTNVIHEVSAWSCRHQLVLGQVKTAAKSNEITAIPELLELLDIKGAVITIDAMGTQKKIAEKIITQEGDYLLALKGNQSTLHDNVKVAFGQLNEEEANHNAYEYVEKEHGRLTTRRCDVITDIDDLEGRKDWLNLSSIIRLQCETTYLSDQHTTTETRYYISSLNKSGEDIEAIIRSHWQIENNLHWVLDVTFSEDACLIHTPNAAENFSLLRKIALTLLKKNPSKGSLKGKRKRAGWNNNFLLELLTHLDP
jgi:predicted transposase YbfD/YdcC